MRLREATLEDDEFLVELVEMFLADAADQLALLEAAIDSPDRSEVSRKAHRLWGACSNVGAEVMAQLCAELEEQSSSGMVIESSVGSRLRDEFVQVSTVLLECVSDAKSRVA
jgi:HPt (histidine-containing phosphotransfer) domain-containing protein